MTVDTLLHVSQDVFYQGVLLQECDVLFYGGKNFNLE